MGSPVMAILFFSIHVLVIRNSGTIILHMVETGLTCTDNTLIAVT